MAPQLYDDTVLISTIPGNAASFYKGNGDGIVWALDAATGKPKWTFNTISDGAKLWGNPKVNSGGGLWYPPAVDSQGRVFISVANPAPLYGTQEVPQRLQPSRAQPLHELARRARRPDRKAALVPAGRPPRPARLRPADPGDPRDRPDRRRPDRGRAGRGEDGQGLRLPRRRRQASLDALRRQAPARHRPAAEASPSTSSPATSAASRRRWRSPPTASSCPGSTSPTTRERNRPRRAASRSTSRGPRRLHRRSTPPPARCSGSASCRRWTSARPRSPTMSSSPAPTPARSTPSTRQTGKTLWTAKAPAGINSFPAIDGDMLLVGAGTTGFSRTRKFQLIAYSLR